MNGAPRSAASIKPVRNVRAGSQRTNSPPGVLDGTALLAHGIGAALLMIVIAGCAFSGDTADALDISKFYVAGTVAALIGAVLSSNLGAVYLIACYYFAVFTAIPALVQIERQQFPFGSSYTDPQLNAGFLVLAVGQSCLMLGTLAVRARRGASNALWEADSSRANIAPLLSSPESDLAARLARVLTLLAGVLAAVAGPEQIFTARFDETTSVVAEGSMSAQLALVARAFALVGLLLGILAVRRWPKEAVLHNPKGTLLFAALVAAVVNYPPALPRFQLLGVVLAVLVLLFNFQRRIIKAGFVAGATLFVLYVFAAIKDLRGGVAFDQIGRIDVGSYLTSVDFDSFKQVVDTVIYFSTAPLRYGANFLGVLLFWVPRSVWSGKPIHTGAIVSAGLGYPYNNVSNPLPAEGYASWGMFGTIVAMLLVGLAIGWLEGRRNPVRGAQRSIPSLIGYALASGYATILLRGALGAVAPMILSAFVLASMVYLFYRRAQIGDQSRRPREAWRSAGGMDEVQTAVDAAHIHKRAFPDSTHHGRAAGRN